MMKFSCVVMHAPIPGHSRGHVMAQTQWYFQAQRFQLVVLGHVMAEPSIYSLVGLAAISDNFGGHEDVHHFGLHCFDGWYVLGVRQMDFVLGADVDTELDGYCALIPCSGQPSTA